MSQLTLREKAAHLFDNSAILGQCPQVGDLCAPMFRIYSKRQKCNSGLRKELIFQLTRIANTTMANGYEMILFALADISKTNGPP